MPQETQPPLLVKDSLLDLLASSVLLFSVLSLLELIKNLLIFLNQHNLLDFLLEQCFHTSSLLSQ